MKEKRFNREWAARASIANPEPPLEALQRGDLAAFDELILRHQSAAYRLACRILTDPAAAQDAIQNAFLDAFRGIHQFHGGSFQAWLLRIVTYTCYDELRRELRHRGFSLDERREEEGAPPGWMIDTRQPNPEEETEQKELFAMIYTQLEHLPADLRTVAVLVDLNELDYAEASRRIQRPVGTLKSRLFRSRSALRRSLQAYRDSGRAGLLS
jgi:RNA polymerase sigma-70 factor, ECF subfamily